MSLFKIIFVAFSAFVFGAATAEDCNAIARQKDGPGGYGTSYHIGNRVPVDKILASKHKLTYLPDIPNFANQWTTVHVGSTAQAGGKTQYVVKISTNQGPGRTARLAWLEPNHHDQDPLFVLDVQSPATGGDAQICATVNNAWNYADLTIQAF